MGDSLSYLILSCGYLGIEVDETLSWQTQVDTIVKKVSAGLGVFKKVRDPVPRQTLVRIYKALVLPYFDYCSEVWGSLGKCLSERLQYLTTGTSTGISQVHAYILRSSSNNIFIRRPETDAARKSFSFRGAVLWNGLPNKTKTQPSITSFKNSLRKLSFDRDFLDFNSTVL